MLTAFNLLGVPHLIQLLWVDAVLWLYNVDYLIKKSVLLNECLTLTEADIENILWKLSLPAKGDKKLFLESRLRESFHVLRLSNRLCRLCHTVFSLFSHGRWVHSGENNESRVVGTTHAGQPQMCQGCWQQRQGEGGGHSQAANSPFCWAVKQAPVLHMAEGRVTSGLQTQLIVSAADMIDVGILQTEMQVKFNT